MKDKYYPLMTHLLLWHKALFHIQACQMTVETVLAQIGAEANLDHCDISSAVSMRPDIILTASNFKTQFEKFNIDPNETKLIYLKNIVSKDEIKEKLTPVLKEIGAL